ncbi:MAG: hypothetical protein KIT14_11940 [bacterium]|nr:hypothetical protein [bacterium]
MLLHRSLRILALALPVIFGVGFSTCSRNPYGINVTFDAANSDTVRLDLARDAGVKWVRIFVPYDKVVGADGGNFAAQEANFNTIVAGGSTQWLDGIIADTMLARQQAHGAMSILIVLKGNPPFNKRTTGLRSCPTNPQNEGWPPKDIQVIAQLTEALARKFKDLADGFEIWNEPTSCTRWGGTRQEFVTQILPTMYDAIFAVQAERTVPAVIGGVAVAGQPNINVVRNWVTWNGSMVRPLDFVSVHYYATRANTKSLMTQLNGFNECYTGPPNFLGAPACTTKFWVTEWGMANNPDAPCTVCQNAHDSQPGQAIRAILDHCNSLSNCQRMFYFSQGISGCTPTACQLSLFKPNNDPRAKYFDFQDYAWVDADDFCWDYDAGICVTPGHAVSDMHCAAFAETADPHAWSDNELCTHKNLGLVFAKSEAEKTAAGAAGLYCVKIEEPSDPDSWNDNYLCAKWDVGVQWSHAGPIAGKSCIQITEPIEPAGHTWTDNWLCFNPKPVVPSGESLMGGGGDSMSDGGEELEASPSGAFLSGRPR